MGGGRIVTQAHRWPWPFQQSTPGKIGERPVSPHCFTQPHIRNLHLSSDPLPQASPLGWQPTDISKACRGLDDEVVCDSHLQGWKVDHASAYLGCDTPCPNPREQASPVSFGHYGRWDPQGSLTRPEYSVLGALHEKLKSSLKLKTQFISI